MLTRFAIFFILGSMLAAGESCKGGKMACPTYADSTPQKKAKKNNKPQIPKATKPKSGVLPKGYGKK